MPDTQYEQGGGGAAQKGSSSSMRVAPAGGAAAAGGVAGGAAGGAHTRGQQQQQHAGGGGGGAAGGTAAAAKAERQSRTIAGGSAHPCMSYDVGKVLGNGSFGVVTEARCLDTGEVVAIKKVLQDPRYKNRELDIMKELRHPNVVKLLDYFYTEMRDSRERSSSSNSSSSNHHREAGGGGGGGGAASGGSEHNRFLNVVMEHIPETVYRVMKTFVRANQAMPFLLVKLYTYQMCRALGYLHALGICHRDIKPQNLLVDSRTHVLKLCDFGSAKRLIPGEQSVAYICSRFYRAPELMLGASEYTTAIDIWSIGCVLGELLLCRPLFAGDTSVDQLVKIIQVLGTPTRGQMATMNPNYTEFQFPDVKPRDWKVVFGSHSAAHDTSNPSFEQAINLLGQFLRYEPGERLLPLEALAHEFFDELRLPTTRLPGGGPLPELFTFSSLELQHMSPAAQAHCIPPHIANANKMS